MKKRIVKFIWILPILLCVLAGFSETNSQRKNIDLVNISSNIPEIVEKETSTVHKDWIKDIPEYSGVAYVEINGNKPFFREDEYTTKTFETYSKLDNLGRCGVAFALVGTETMPEKERSSIGMVKPTGWHTVRYDSVIKDKYLYNRCHLIAFELSGENANPNNLITGTRYMNTSGMLPFENKVAEYIKSTKNHVLYRVTPIFYESNLLANGVLMEAYSVEDNGSGIMFNVYCYNVQPGIEIDYSNGNSRLIENIALPTNSPTIQTSTSNPIATNVPSTTVLPKNSQTIQTTTPSINNTKNKITYILNTNSKKFHFPTCYSAARIKDINRLEYTGNREDIIAKGYKPCGNCKP